MWYLYLDESGDLGFDFVNKKPSKFFTITILAVSDIGRNRQLIKAVKTVLRRKLNRGRHKRRMVQELKATKTTFEIKKYLFNRLRDIHFGIYAVTLNKRMVFDKSMSKPEIVEFNAYIRRQLEARLNPKAPLNIVHENSCQNYGIQLADMFSWGIFVKYEKRDSAGFNLFREKVRLDESYF